MKTFIILCVVSLYSFSAFSSLLRTKRKAIEKTVENEQQIRPAKRVVNVSPDPKDYKPKPDPPLIELPSPTPPGRHSSTGVHTE